MWERSVAARNSIRVIWYRNSIHLTLPPPPKSRQEKIPSIY